MEGQMGQGLPCEVEFGSFSQEQIKKLSVVLIQSPLTFNSLNHPLPGGVYDPALGPFDHSSVCTTCHLRQIKCPGHFGHLELPMPVLNPIFIKAIISIMKMICLECHKILIPEMSKTIFKAQMNLIINGYIVEAQEVSNFVHQDAKETFYLDEEKLIKFVDSTLSNGSAKTFEYKGENDYRNTFLRNVLSQISKNKTCLYCKSGVKKVSSVAEKIFIPAKLETAAKFSKTKKISSTSNFEQILPKRIKMHLSEVYKNEKDFLDMLLPILKTSEDIDPINCLFMDLVLVTPTKSRPINIVDGTVSEHPQNSIYKQILLTCSMMRALIGQAKNENLNDETISALNALQGKSNEEKLKNSYNELQMHVSSLLDTEVLKQRNPNGLGLKQVIEKKEGIIRMNMMGKRVNYAARTVITPDPNLNVDEIGIPEEFAKKLTYPVPVTAWNVTELRKLVYRGPMVHPGAVYVENEDGTSLKLDPYDLVQRKGVANKLLTPGDVHGIKILHRHLQNGDILLLNRQPTLHRPSIMAHKARVLQGEKTFRLHYANCKSYNADFDGDEMNAHFPQNEVARSEGYNIVSASKQYLVPKDGTPLSGLIQDHVVSGVRLTIRGKFFTRQEYMQLVFQGLSYLHGDIKILPPSILKPEKLWSGKQVVSTIIINVIKSNCINLTSKSKVPENAWKGGSSLMSEAEVVIRQGELLCGILDKMHYGSTPYSLVHCVYELYGGEVATRLLSSFAKLFTAFLQYEGFTLGVEDILVVPKADNKRTKLIKKARQIGNEVVLKTIDVTDGDIKKALSSSYKDPMFSALLDHQYKKSLDVFTNNINKTCLPAGLLKPFPANNLQLMVQSGAKGSTVNTMQISCLLGQIELEGKRPPLMASGRSLPSFPPFETSPRAGGFVDGRFMTGIKPQEFFFHCMAGREGLIDTAVKTSRSGYLQRCLVKHLEGLTVHYDMTVRDSDGSVIQFLYGEDGLEVTKSQFLNKRQLPFLAENLVSAHDPEIVDSLKSETTHKIRSLAKSIRKYNKKHTQNDRSSPFLNFCREQSCDLKGFDASSGRSKAAIHLIDKWMKMSHEEKWIYAKKIKKRPDPVMSKYQADRHFGAITEKLDSIMDEYLKTNNQVDADLLKEMVYLKAQTSLCSPGEPVGLLAAQSIGEPSTQMTLNTFHFAGRGEMNVTLGIPRLREVLMVASKNIKTPSMEIPFKKDIPNIEEKIEKLRKSLTRITMADVLERAEITERIETSSNSSMMIYVIKLYFLPEEAYSEKTHLKSSQILKFVEKKFLKTFVSYVMMKKKQLKELIASEAEGRNREADEEDPDDPKTSKRGAGNDYQSSDDEPENDDDDATTQRRRQRQNEEQQYSDEDDEEDEETKIENESQHENEEPEEANTSIRKSIIVHDNILEYKCDKTNHEWCEVKIGFPVSSEKLDLAGKLKEFAAISVITQVPGIKRAFISTKNDGTSVLTTDGKNLREMYYHMDILDLNKLYTNDINAVAEKYGIEAASKAIVKEVQSVFNVYGITVDFRHLSLVADYMTFYGYYRSLSRVGLEGGSSPLQQMSFESPLGFLRSAITRAQKDNLKSPSSRLMLGQPVLAGTGSFHLLHCFKI